MWASVSGAGLGPSVVRFEGNDAGPKACEQLAETIAQTSLKALSLEGNNLTQGGEDGFKELCKGLRASSLTRLSLWRCNLPQSCGPSLAEGVGPSLFLLETGGNLFLERDLDDIEDRLRANRDRRDQDAEAARLLRRKTRKEAKAKAAADALAASNATSRSSLLEGSKRELSGASKKLRIKLNERPKSFWNGKLGRRRGWLRLRARRGRRARRGKKVRRRSSLSIIASAASGGVPGSGAGGSSREWAWRASWAFGREVGARRDFHVTVPRHGVIVTVLGLVRTQGDF